MASILNSRFRVFCTSFRIQIPKIRAITSCLCSREILASQNPIESLYSYALDRNFINVEGFRLPGKPFAFQLAELDVRQTIYTDSALSQHSLNLRTVGFQRVHPDLGIEYLTFRRRPNTFGRPLPAKDFLPNTIKETDSSEGTQASQPPHVAISYTVGEGPFNGKLSAQWRGEGLVKTLKVDDHDRSCKNSLEAILASSNAPTGSIAQIMASAKSSELFGTLNESSGRTRYSLSEDEREKFINLTRQIKADLLADKYDLQSIAQYVSVLRFQPMRMELCVTNADDPNEPGSLASEGIWERFEWTVNTQWPNDTDASNSSHWQGPVRLRPY